MSGIEEGAESRQLRGDEIELLTPREASKFLKVCEKTLRQVTKTRGIPVLRLGKRKVLYRRDQLVQWVIENSHATAV